MFISRKKWSELQERLCDLENKVKVLEYGQKSKFGYVELNEHLYPYRDETHTIKQIVLKILNHLNLKIKVPFPGIELVPKDDK